MTTLWLARPDDLPEEDRATLEAVAGDGGAHYVSFNTAAHGMMLDARLTEMTAAAFEKSQSPTGPEAVLKQQ